MFLDSRLRDREDIEIIELPVNQKLYVISLENDNSIRPKKEVFIAEDFPE